jgi:hypothetical protein
VQLTRFTALVAASAAFAAFSSDFQYQVPDGFRELRTATRPGDADESKVPRQLLQLARNPRYALVAIDPQSTSRDAVGATFNVVEMKSTGHMTLDLAKNAATAIAAQFKSQGISATVVDVSVVPMNGVDTSVTTMDLEGGSGTMRMRQYVLPGLNGAAVLSYSAPRADFEKFYPAFLRSLKATRGVAEPESVGWSWKEFFKAGLMGGLIGALLGVARYVIKKLKRRGDPDGAAVAGERAPAATTPHKPRPSKHLWYCDDCGKPVPIRLDLCRCGGRKPA